LLFPEAIYDYVTDDNPVRFIEAFVDHLDLNQLSFSRTTPAHTGRPAYDLADLLKLYIYGGLAQKLAHLLRAVTAILSFWLRGPSNQKVLESILDFRFPSMKRGGTTSL